MDANCTALGRRSPIVLVVSGPSGVGKGTVVARLLEADPCLRLSVSATTRAPGEGEEHGRTYWFLSRDEFQAAVGRDAFFEHAEYCGQLYGTPRSEVDRAREEGRDLILEIEVQGARQVRAADPSAVLTMVIPPSREVCEQRLIARGRDTMERIAERMATYDREIVTAAEFDYIIVNDDLGRAAGDLRAVIEAERLRVFGRLAAERVIAGARYDA